MNHVVWRWRNEGSSCLLLPPERVPRSFELYEGVPRATGFPADALFRMSHDHPKNMGLTDNLMNVGTLLVASLALKRFFEARPLKNVEYLPVTIVNHKERVASRDYFIVHPVVPQDCLDIQASGSTYSTLVPTDIGPTAVGDPGGRYLRDVELAHLLKAMTDKGLKEVTNPSAIFLTRAQESVPGSVPPLVLRTSTGSPRKVVSITHFAFSGLRLRQPWLVLVLPCAHTDQGAEWKKMPL